MNRAMQLGELLALGEASSAELAAWLRAQDPRLAQWLQSEARQRQESIDQFLRIAVADFLAEADDEAWASLVSALQDASDPGVACVARVADFRLRLEQKS